MEALIHIHGVYATRYDIATVNPYLVMSKSEFATRGENCVDFNATRARESGWRMRDGVRLPILGHVREPAKNVVTVWLRLGNRIYCEHRQ
ncbi:MAG: hypothetical protein P4L53_06250 [Candidatus Obscuribacterales bacterium]|nr:hypothetical protein [Candidatus Obscuribacterales bacterium]